MNDVGACQVCGNEATSRCSGCFTTCYCGPDHQKQDWKDHKNKCTKPYTIEKNDLAGRHMVASRNLKTGDIILREKAAVVGPSMDQSRPVCLSCYASLKHNHHPCSSCHAPLCSKQCEKNPQHVPECKLMRQAPWAMYSTYDKGTIVKRKKQLADQANYQLILPLRAFLLKSQDVKKYKALLALQSHLEEREVAGKTETVKERVVHLLQQYPIQDGQENMIQTFCGIFDTNCFELCPSGAGDSISGIFPSASMMMHSCFKNTRLTFSDDHVITILARSDINKGDNIYHTYARTLNPTTIRRISLFSGKHFDCHCVRCLDPKELGSYASALKCTMSCKGVVTAKDPLDLTQNAVWSCDSCSNSIPALQVAAQERRLMMELSNIDRGSIPSLESFVEKYSQVLHPNHAFIMEAKKHLSVGYGRFPGFEIENLSTEKLKKKVALCREVLDVIAILEPGISTQRGLTLYELWLAEIGLADKEKEVCHINGSKYSEIATQALTMLEESARIMRYEPRNSIHGRLSLDLDVKLEKEIERVAKLPKDDRRPSVSSL